MSGLIQDKKDNLPIPGALISIDHKNTGSTSLDGSYSLELTEGHHLLDFSCIGYQNYSVELDFKTNENKKLDIVLEPTATLDIIVVSASQYEKKLTQETVSMDVLGKGIIKNTNAVQLGDVVAKSPGVQVQDGQISIRGGSSYAYGAGSRTAVLVDGLNYLSGDLNDAQLKFAPLEMAEQVEIIKGAASVMYGSSALNGVVNMRTGWGTDKAYNELTSFYTLYGNPSLKPAAWWANAQPHEVGLSLLSKQKIKTFNYVASANYYQLKSFLTGNDEIRFRVAVKTKWSPKKVAGLIMGIDINSMYENSGRFFLSQDADTNIYRRSAGSDDRYFRLAIDPHLIYTAKRNNKFSILARLLNVYRFGSAGIIPASSWSYNIDIQHQKKITLGTDKFITITSGLPFTITNNISNLFEGFSHLYTYNVAAYVQAELKLNRFDIVGGIRYEIQKVVEKVEYNLPVFRVGANYQATKSTFVRASWGQGYRMPSLAEKYLYANLIGSNYVLPNRELKTEKAWNFEAGVKQVLMVKKNWKALFDFSVFLQQYKNLVEYNVNVYENKYDNGEKIFKDQGDYIFGFKPFNTPDARVMGYEASMVSQGKIGAVELNSLIGYTYNFPGNSTTNSPNQKFKDFYKNTFKYMFKRMEASDYNFIDTNRTGQTSILQYRTRHMIRVDLEIKYKKIMFGYCLNYNSFGEVIPTKYYAVFNSLDNGKQSLAAYAEKHKRGDAIMDLRMGFTPNEHLSLTFLVKNFTNRLYAARIGRADAPISFTLQARYKF
jgi:iron complex outermembrane receptor protein